METQYRSRLNILIHACLYANIICRLCACFFRFHREISHKILLPPFPTPRIALNYSRTHLTLGPSLLILFSTSASPLLLPSLHLRQTPREVLLQPQLAPQERTRLLQPLDIPRHHPRRILAAAWRQAHLDDVQHALVQAGVEVRAAAGVGVVVPALVAAVGVEVAAELDDELEGEGGAAGEGGEVFDGGDQLGEGGGEGGGGEVRGEGVLQAVQVVVQDGHFAVELVV